MKAKLSIVALLVFASATASAQSLYLTCEPVSVTEFGLEDVYAKPPANGRDQYMSDLIAMGMLGWALQPPQTWIVDAAAKTVTSPDHPEQFSFTEADITRGKIRAATSWKIFDLNRVNGMLKYTKNLGKDEIEQWRSAHGGTLPAITEWTYSCTSSTKPAV